MDDDRKEEDEWRVDEEDDWKAGEHLKEKDFLWEMFIFVLFYFYPTVGQML